MYSMVFVASWKAKVLFPIGKRNENPYGEKNIHAHISCTKKILASSWHLMSSWDFSVLPRLHQTECEIWGRNREVQSLLLPCVVVICGGERDRYLTSLTAHDLNVRVHSTFGISSTFQWICLVFRGQHTKLSLFNGIFVVLFLCFVVLPYYET